MEAAVYLIPVETFAEIELKGDRVFNRDEFRAICDQAKTRDAILRTLGSR
jgi:hypothetical protein